MFSSTPTPISKLISAINFATIAHRNQKRKDSTNTPYINHPIEVMYILSDVGIVDIDVLCAAVLHDTVEDCGVTYTELVDKFGSVVADYVLECSDDKSLTKVERKKLQITHAKEISIGAKLIKAADKYSNIKDLIKNPPVGWNDQQIIGYINWSYAVYQNLKGQNETLDLNLEKIFACQELPGISSQDLDYRLSSYYQSIQ